MRRGLIAAPACAAVALGITGCGATKYVTTTQTTTRTVTSTTTTTRTRVVHTKPPAAANTPAQPASSAASAPSSKSSLTVQDFGGSTLSVMISVIIDPATATDPAINGPSSGNRLIAVELTLQDQGPGTISDNANSDATVIGSDSQDYTPSFADVAGCTNFNNGDYALSSGSTQRGCVVYELPSTVTVQSVQFSLGGHTVQFNRS